MSINTPERWDGLGFPSPETHEREAVERHREPEFSILIAECLQRSFGEKWILEDTLRSGLGLAADAGARPFELILGAPLERYGARLTFSVGAHGAAVATALGMEEHPWGPPDWVGLRVDQEGCLASKPYHRADRGERRSEYNARMVGVAGFVPVMAARWRGREELYGRLAGALRWRDLVECLEDRFGLRVPEIPVAPRMRDGALGFSVCWEEGGPVAVSAFVGASALPADRALFKIWGESLPMEEKRAFEAASLLVRALGPPPLGSWTGLISATAERGGSRHRAISLRIPRPRARMDA